MGIIFLDKKLRKKWGKKSKKPVGGVCASQDWSQKNPLAKRIFLHWPELPGWPGLIDDDMG